MATAKKFRQQAARCSVLAEQTRDDDARNRYLRLEQIYLQIAETEEGTVKSSAGTAA